MYTKARASYRQALVLSPYNTVVHRLLVSLPEFVKDTAGAAAGVEVDEPVVPAAPAVIAATSEHAPVSALPSAVEPAGTKLTGDLPPLATPSPLTAALHSAAAHVPPVPAAQAESKVVQPLPDPADTKAAGPVTEDAQQHATEQEWFPINDPIPDDVLAEEASTPSFEPFPTFEQYIDLHPATEPTMTLEEYLKGRISSPMSEPSTDFESLAKKLQNAKRIVPSETVPPPMLSPDEPASAGQMIVSPTMAEIYVSQQEYAMAISVYQLLSNRQPEQAAVFGKRIAELQELLKIKQG
jgi:hypothetical protein